MTISIGDQVRCYDHHPRYVNIEHIFPESYIEGTVVAIDDEAITVTVSRDMFDGQPAEFSESWSEKAGKEVPYFAPGKACGDWDDRITIITPP